MRPLMLPVLLLCLLIGLVVGCHDEGPTQRDLICSYDELDTKTWGVSTLFEPCLVDGTCVVGTCKNGFCSEDCSEDNDCQGAIAGDGAPTSRCEVAPKSTLGHCVYTCYAPGGDNDGIDCPGYDIDAPFANFSCVSEVCMSTFSCEGAR